MKAMFIRGFNNYDADKVSLENGLTCLDESRTVQSEKEDADINTIVKRFGLGYSPPQDLRVPLAEDFTDAVDFQSAMTAIRSAEESFNELHADVRSRFGNDPGAFVRFCTEQSDGKLVNLAELKKLGLAVERVPERNIPVEMLEELRALRKASAKAEASGSGGNLPV